MVENQTIASHGLLSEKTVLSVKQRWLKAHRVGITGFSLNQETQLILAVMRSLQFHEFPEPVEVMCNRTVVKLDYSLTSTDSVYVQIYYDGSIGIKAGHVFLDFSETGEGPLAIKSKLLELMGEKGVR